MPSTLGERLRDRRKKKGLSLDDLATATKTSKSYLWELENRDETPRPSAEKLGVIAKTLGVTIDYFLDETGALTEEDASDAEFYRQFRQLKEKDKAKVRAFLELWDDDQ